MQKLILQLIKENNELTDAFSLTQEIPRLLLHDIISPLTHLALVSRKLQDHLEHQADAHEARRLAELISQTLSGILLLSRDSLDWLSSVKTKTAELSDIDVPGLLDQILSLYPAASGRIVTGLISGTVRADQRILSAVLRNVIDNAIKHSDGPVHITTGSARGHFIFDITDFGKQEKTGRDSAAADRHLRNDKLGLRFIQALTLRLNGLLQVDQQTDQTIIRILLPLTFE